MIDEHFGIAIAEMLCSGLIVVAHKSAGPRDDILCKEKYGLLARDN